METILWFNITNEISTSSVSILAHLTRSASHRPGSSNINRQCFSCKSQRHYILGKLRMNQINQTDCETSNGLVPSYWVWWSIPDGNINENDNFIDNTLNRKTIAYKSRPYLIVGDEKFTSLPGTGSPFDTYFTILKKMPAGKIQPSYDGNISYKAIPDF